MARPSKSFFEVDSSMLPPGKNLTLPEVKDPGPYDQASDIDVVSNADLDLEAFMNEKVKVMMNDSVSEGDLLVEQVSVNGINQFFVRGKEQVVRRMFVEALAQARISGYTQKQTDPSDPSALQMIEASRLKYPFVVLEDKNPRGRDWLKSILQSY